MKMHTKKFNRVLSVLLVIVLMAVVPCSAVGASSPTKADSGSTAADTTYRKWLDIKSSDLAVTIPYTAMRAIRGEPKQIKGALEMKPGDTVTMTANLPKAGKYFVVMEYMVAEGMMIGSTVNVTVGDHSVLAGIYGLWQDATKDYGHDRYGNEVTPNQVLLDEYVTDYVRDSKYLDASPVEFELKAGSNTITFENCDEDIYLRSISIAYSADVPTYEEYINEQKDLQSAKDIIIIEGEDYAVKSDSHIRSTSNQNPAVYPYSPYKKYISSIDEQSYATVGQRVVWNFEVPEDGWYYLALHYSQSLKEGIPVYRDIEIDGEVPYKELENIGFQYTASGFKNKIVGAEGEDQQPLKVYLTKGNHTIGLFAQAPLLTDVYVELSDIMRELTDIGLDLQQVAGVSADKNRSWDIESYIPGITKALKNLEKRLLEMYDEMALVAGTTPASCINLKLAADVIAQTLKKPEKLPVKAETLSTGSGSANELIANFQDSLRTQGLAIDRIFLYGEDNELPPESAGFFTSLSSGIKRFFHSMFNKDTAYAASATEDGVLNVWVSRAVTYVETMQLLADSYFTPETGIQVQFSVMPGENKLILSNASNTCPDVAVGVGSATSFQLGLRGAAASFGQFEDVEEFALENFNMADLDPYICDRELYGLPETMDFSVLMYRKDITDKLGIKIPDTWDDVAEIMPVLRRNGMQFFVPISATSGTKPLGSMLPFFYQAGAVMYSDDGMKATFNSSEGIKAFETLTNLFALYSVQQNMPSFYNNFRYGTAPIGIGGFGDYMRLLYAAPEIADSWEIALAPGTADENGKVNRQYMSSGTGVLVMESSNMKDESWEFIKWWLSADTQSEFGNMLLVKFGSEYIWNSANIKAFNRLSIPSEDREVIVEQWSYSQNYRNAPATYMLEREISDAFYDVINNGTPARVALNDATAVVNNEIEIKMKEFGYLDENGKKIKDFDMQTIQEVFSKEAE